MEDDPQPINIPFCVDCKHYAFKAGYEICTRTPYSTDYVSGKQNFVSCASNRLNELENTCGPSGKLFEPKPIKWYQFWKK